MSLSRFQSESQSIRNSIHACFSQELHFAKLNSVQPGRSSGPARSHSVKIESVGDIDWALVFYVAMCAIGGAVVGAIPGAAAVMALSGNNEHARFLLGGGLSGGAVVGAIAGSSAILAKTFRPKHSNGGHRRHRHKTEVTQNTSGAAAGESSTAPQTEGAGHED
jgi:hypothetical protein